MNWTYWFDLLWAGKFAELNAAIAQYAPKPSGSPAEPSILDLIWKLCLVLTAGGLLYAAMTSGEPPLDYVWSGHLLRGLI